MEKDKAEGSRTGVYACVSQGTAGWAAGWMEEAPRPA